MPLDRRAGRRSEEEVKAGGVVEHAQTKGPVLVARIGGLRVGATLTDDIRVLALAEAVGLDPGFEGDCVAVLEVEVAVLPRVLNLEVRAFTVEAGGIIRLFETWVVRATRARLLELHVTGRGEFRAGCSVERPYW